MTKMPLNITHAAQAIWDARKNRTPIERVSTSFGIENTIDAYAVAAINTNRKIKDGTRITGKKIGLTSRAVQEQLGVNQPDYGILFDDMGFRSGDVIPMNRLIQPKIEAEIAFIVGRDLQTENPTYDDFLRSLDSAIPALEIVDSAIANWNITIADTIADNASCGLYVLGNQHFKIEEFDLSGVPMKLSRNKRIESSGTGAACLDHPLNAAYWLAKTMCKLGQGLCTGEVILSGALGPMVILNSNDQIEANFGPLGSVSCHAGE